MAEYYMASHLLALQRFPSCIQHLQLLNHRLFVYILLFFFEYLWSISKNQQTDKQEYFMYMTRATKRSLSLRVVNNSLVKPGTLLKTHLVTRIEWGLSCTK